MGGRSPAGTPHLAADDAFFREWDARALGARRSLERARELRELVGPAAVPPVLTVVGSKGKGTAAGYASAYLAAVGLRVVTVTSPALRHQTERIRVAGAAVGEDTLAGLGARLATGLDRLPPPGTGYASPSGLFTLAGALLAAGYGADPAVPAGADAPPAAGRPVDALVLEAGKGGRSDEVSLFDPDVVAIGPVFGEHLAELGGSLEAVAADKCGVIGDRTRAVVVGDQPDRATAALVARCVAARSGGRLAPLPVPEAPVPGGTPPEWGAANARLGCEAARRLLAARGWPAPDPAVLATTLGTVRLPGRLSTHRVDGAEIVVDGAVDGAGFAAAVRYATERWGAIDHAVVSVPDGKDLAGAAAALAGLPVTAVTVAASHLRYTAPVPPGWRVVPATRVDRAWLAGRGARVLAAGTGSFVGHLLTVLDVPTAILFTAP